MNVNLDIHKLPFAIREKFLNLLGIQQSTEGIPHPGLNLVRHFRDDSVDELRKRTLELSRLPGSEGNVVTDAGSEYKLTYGARPWQMLKFRKSFTLNAIVLDLTETKTQGVFIITWGLVNDETSRPVIPENIKKIGDSEYMVSGKTFSTKLKPEIGDHIKIEAESFNSIYYEELHLFDVSAWAPRVLEVTDEDIDTIKSAENKASEVFLLQLKVVNADGQIDYLNLSNKSFDDVLKDGRLQYAENNKIFSKGDAKSFDKYLTDIDKIKDELEEFEKQATKIKLESELKDIYSKIIDLFKKYNISTYNTEDSVVTIRQSADHFVIEDELKALDALKKLKLFDQVVDMKPEFDMIKLRRLFEEKSIEDAPGIKKVSGEGVYIRKK